MTAQSGIKVEQGAIVVILEQGLLPTDLADAAAAGDGQPRPEV